MKPIAISIRQATELAPIGVTTLYKLIGQGRLKSATIDGRRLIDYESFCELLGMGAQKPAQSVPVSQPMSLSANAGEEPRRAASAKRPRIKGNAERSAQLRRYAKGS